MCIRALSAQRARDEGERGSDGTKLIFTLDSRANQMKMFIQITSILMKGALALKPPLQSSRRGRSLTERID